MFRDTRVFRPSYKTCHIYKDLLSTALDTVDAEDDA